MSSIFTKVKKFFTKHADEIGDVAGVLQTVAAVLPIDRADKQKIIAVADKLQKASEAIADSAERMQDEGLTLNQTDVMRGLGAFLKSKEGKDVIRKAVAESLGQSGAKIDAGKAHALTPPKDAPKNFGEG